MQRWAEGARRQGWDGCGWQWTWAGCSPAASSSTCVPYRRASGSEAALLCSARCCSPNVCRASLAFRFKKLAATALPTRATMHHAQPLSDAAAEAEARQRLEDQRAAIKSDTHSTQHSAGRIRIVAADVHPSIDSNFRPNTSSAASTLPAASSTPATAVSSSSAKSKGAAAVAAAFFFFF